MRRSSSPAAGSLSELAALGDDHDGCSSPPALPLDGPPVASDAHWTPAPVKKSSSDPNIARLPGKLVSRLLTRLLTLLVQRLADSEGTARALCLEILMRRYYRIREVENVPNPFGWIKILMFLFRLDQNRSRS